MSSTQQMDWEALAKQAGSVGYKKGSGQQIDWGALAKEAQQPQSGAPAGGFDPQQAAQKPIAYGYERAGNVLAEAGKDLWNTVKELPSVIFSSGFTPITGPSGQTHTGLASDIVKSHINTYDQAMQAAQQGNTPKAMFKSVAAGVPLVGPMTADIYDAAEAGNNEKALGMGLSRGGQLLAPAAVKGIKGLRSPVPPAAEVAPAHVEALTGLIDDRAGAVDPHTTANAALPTLRETAVRMKLDPSKLEGRGAGQAAVKVAEQAVRDAQNEFKTISKPYQSVLVEQKPIADAYRSMITDEMRANEPKIARALEREAAKFDQPAPLQQVDQFRTRMNNQLEAFEKRGTSQQIMSDMETKAHAAAANAAREVEYQTVGRLSGLDEAYLRQLKQREGSLIEAKRSLEKEFNRASGAQGEAASKSLREKVATVYPSPRGVQHGAIREFIGPKPIDILNHRLSVMFKDMGPASELPEYEIQAPEAPKPESGEWSRQPRLNPVEHPEVPPATMKPGNPAIRAKVAAAEEAADAKLQQPKAPVVEGGKVSEAHVAEENAFYTQARAELGAAADPIAVLRKAQELKLKAQAAPAAQSAPAPKPTLTQKMQAQPLPRMRRVLKPPVKAAESPSGASAGQQATAIMLQLKQGLISNEEADSRIQRLVGPGGRRTQRIGQ